MSSERRHANRDTCQLDAFVRTSQRVEAIACVVEDISETGAKLRFEEFVDLPLTFALMLPLIGDHSDERRVELLWRVGNAAGIRFAG